MTAPITTITQSGDQRAIMERIARDVGRAAVFICKEHCGAVPTHGDVAMILVNSVTIFINDHKSARAQRLAIEMMREIIALYDQDAAAGGADEPRH